MSNIEINNSDSPQNFLSSNNNFLSFGKFDNNEIPNYSIPVSNFDLKSNEQTENSFSNQLNSPKFSIPLDLFGTCYNTEKDGKYVQDKEVLNEYEVKKCVYPIGLDPV